MDFVPGYILVSKRETMDDNDFDSLIRNAGGSSHGKVHHKLRTHKVKVKEGREKAIVEILKREGGVEFAELDEYVDPTLTPNDPGFSAQWHLTKIGAPTAWNTSVGSGVVIAIVDGGVQTNHPDLAANIVAGRNVWDNNTTVTDVTGHGTACAGVAAAVGNNAVGVVGVAYGAKIMPIRATSATGSGTFSSASNAVIWAADNGAKVVSVSWSNLYKSSTVQSAGNYLKSKGGVLVVSANNNGIDEGSPATSSMVVVGATDKNDALAAFPNGTSSSFGSMVDCCAPGVSIKLPVWNSQYNNGDAYGTSFATPQVAGVLALIFAARPDFTPDQAVDALLSTAVDLGGTGFDSRFGYGRINAAAAIAKATNAPAPDAIPPSVTIDEPIAGAAVTGTIGVRVTATDNVGVTRVDLKAGNAVVATLSATPYVFSWNSRSVANGAVTLSAVAYDQAGNSTTRSVNLSVNNDWTAPTVAFVSPANGASLFGTVQIQTSAADASGITQSLAIDGVAVATAAGTSLNYNWNTKNVARGQHVLAVTASDVHGNTATATITVQLILKRAMIYAKDMTVEVIDNPT